jgi:hypothetical protein
VRGLRHPLQRGQLGERGQRVVLLGGAPCPPLPRPAVGQHPREDGGRLLAVQRQRGHRRAQGRDGAGARHDHQPDLGGRRVAQRQPAQRRLHVGQGVEDGVDRAARRRAGAHRGGPDGAEHPQPGGQRLVQPPAQRAGQADQGHAGLQRAGVDDHRVGLVLGGRAGQPREQGQLGGTGQGHHRGGRGRRQAGDGGQCLAGRRPQRLRRGQRRDGGDGEPGDVVQAGRSPAGAEQQQRAGAGCGSADGVAAARVEVPAHRGR